MEGPEDQPTDAAALEAAARENYLAGDIEGAVGMLRRAIELDPNLPHLYANLGVALAVLGRTDEAIPVLEKALSHQPGWAQVRANLAQAYVSRANSLLSTRRFAEAAQWFQRALTLWPGHGWALNNLAVALQELGRLDEALALCVEAVQRDPDFAEAHYNRGRILQDLDRQEEAGHAFEQALNLRPGYAQARNNLAMTLGARGRFEEAVVEYRRAMESDRAYDDPRINIGVALRDAGHVDEAVAHYRSLLEVRPDLAEARWNLGITLLRQGRLEEGFAAAEARRRIPRLKCNRTFEQPQWQGEDLEGRTILLHAEQGFGDVIQFVRYAPLVRGRGAKVVLLCQRELKRLFEAGLGIDSVFAEGEPLPEFHLHCPLMTLPVIFRTGLGTIPNEVPYVGAEESIGAPWRAQLASDDGNRTVGLAWAGSPGHVNDRQRSIRPELLDPLGRVAGVKFVSLQKSRPAGGQLPFELVDHTTELSDFADTAGLIANLDLVITVDTAVAHLAGAMAKPVWVMLPYVPDWRWLEARADSPWYPTMRLFRQHKFGDWESVVARVVDAISCRGGALSPP